MAFETEFSFTLPRGFVDSDGNIHKEGVMRLACAADEIVPLRNPEVQKNPAYLTILILSRVITRLGTLTEVNTGVIENLFTMDLAYLQDFYEKINSMEMPVYKCTCPNCGAEVAVPVNFMEAAE